MKKSIQRKTTPPTGISRKEIKNEATRYIDNAVDILKEKGQLVDGQYTDKKYIKMASHTAYTGVLYALDMALAMPKKQRNDIKEYHKQLSTLNRKMNGNLEDVYQILHLQGSYDGYGNRKALSIGFKAASELIDWCANHIN